MTGGWMENLAALRKPLLNPERFGSDNARCRTEETAWAGGRDRTLIGVLVRFIEIRSQRRRPNPLVGFRRVASIGPDQLQPGEVAQQLGQSLPGVIPVLNVIGVHHNDQQQTHSLPRT